MNDFYYKLKTTVRFLLKNKMYLDKDSYYPAEEHKSRREMICDQLYFLWKYGKIEKFYFTYGFDRKEMPRKRICEEYIINENAFLKKINEHNDHINRKQGRFSGRCIVSDKFYFYLFLNGLHIPTPKILYYTRNGRMFYSNNDQVKDIESIFSCDFDGFAKPYGGQLGNGAFALQVKDSKVLVHGEPVSDTGDLVRLFKETNYVIQERIVQHPKMNSLCSTAVNTIRLLTLITPEEEIIVFRAGLRMGREGNNVDNCAKGGIFVGIDLNTGKLMKNGIIKPPKGTLTECHPDSKIVFEGFEIPYFKEAVELAKELHAKLYRIHSVGWDIAITPEGPMFIEGNSLWEISGTQAAVGGVKFIEKFFD